jgi:restriction endonuclease S subunit
MSTGHSKLGDLVEIRSGYHFRRGVNTDPLGRARVIQLTDLSQSNCIEWGNLPQVNGEDIAKDYFIRRGDVLLSSRGNRSHVILVDQDVVDVVAPNYLLILRITSKLITSEYLSWYLQQPQAQVQIERARRGTTVQLISRGELAELTVPIPPLQLQEKIAKIGALALKEQDLLDQLKVERQRLISASLQRVTDKYVTN